MSKYRDIGGSKYGLLTVLSYVKTERGAAYWLCECDCGKQVVKLGSEITRSYGRYTAKSCGCTHGKNHSLSKTNKDPEKVMRNNIYNVFLRNARNRKLSVSISYEKWCWLSTQPCHYCGSVKTNRGRNSYKPIYPDVCQRKDFLYNGIDRLDNSVGYTESNCVACCFQCNAAKRTSTEGEFLQFIKKVYEYRGLGNTECQQNTTV